MDAVLAGGVLWLAMGLGLGFVAMSRGRSGFAWCMASLLLSPLVGILLMLLSDRSGEEKPNPWTHVKCPDCAELVRAEAKVCKHCGCRLVPQVTN